MENAKALKLPKFKADYLPDGVIGLISLKAIAMSLTARNKVLKNKHVEEAIKIIIDSHRQISYDLQNVYEKEAIIGILENKLYHEMQLRVQAEEELKNLKNSKNF